MKKILIMFIALFLVACDQAVQQEVIVNNEPVVQSPESNDAVVAENDTNVAEEVTIDESAILADNSQNSLDWPGIYMGIIPCASCEGIEVYLELHIDNTFKGSYTYMKAEDELFEFEGKFSWSEDGRKITLEGVEMPLHYKVMEGALLQLDMNGDVIDGAHKDMYILKQQN